MRVETVQLRAPEDWVFRWARWGGLALLFYAGVLALDNLPSARDGHPLWTLLVLMLPYVAPAYVLLFSSERLAGHDSAAPRWFGLAVVTASLALAIRVVASDDRLMGPVYAEGAWSALRILTGTGLAMGILLLLVTSNGGGRLRRLMPAIAIAGGLALAAGTTALSLRDLLNFDSPSVWRVLGSVVPAGGLAFVLIVAGLYRIDPLKARRIAVVLVAALVVAGAATAVGMVTDTRFSAPWWLVGVNLATRGVHVVLVLAFGGILDRPRGYGAASVCLLATIICTAGYVVQFHDEVQGLGLFWLASINLVGVGSVLLLALVTVEVMTREEAQVAVQGAA